MLEGSGSQIQILLEVPERARSTFDMTLELLSATKTFKRALSLHRVKDL